MAEVYNSYEQRDTFENYSAIEKREEELELLLAGLHVNKIDTDDEADIIILQEMQENLEQLEWISTLSDPFDSAPDLFALADAFSLYMYDGKYTYNGSTYSYRQIKVIDNKNANALMCNKEYDLVPQKTDNGLIANILKYNFGFILSSFLGQTATGRVVDWTLGNLFSFLSSSEGVSFSRDADSKPFYTINCTSLTAMSYFYCYDDSAWKLIGSSATADIEHEHSFYGVVYGEIKHEHIKKGWSVYSGGRYYDYIKAYVDTKPYNSKFHKIDRLGTIKIKGYGEVFDFIPKFFDAPGYIY